MLIKKGVISCLKVIVGCCTFLSVTAIAANTVSVTQNGKVATLTLPLKATITTDTVTRNAIEVIPLSSLYELIAWNSTTKAFHPHDFLVRVLKERPTTIRFQIVNDQYTCSYANPDWGPQKKPGETPDWQPVTLPPDIAIVNATTDGYSYTVTWSTGTTPITSRVAEIKQAQTQRSWLDTIDKTKQFIDLTLNIQFPKVSHHKTLMEKGGICRGSVTMLISEPL